MFQPKKKLAEKKFGRKKNRPNIFSGEKKSAENCFGRICFRPKKIRTSFFSTQIFFGQKFSGRNLFRSKNNSAKNIFSRKENWSKKVSAEKLFGRIFFSADPTTNARSDTIEGSWGAGDPPVKFTMLFEYLSLLYFLPPARAR